MERLLEQRAAIMTALKLPSSLLERDVWDPLRKNLSPQVWAQVRWDPLQRGVASFPAAD